MRVYVDLHNFVQKACTAVQGLHVARKYQEKSTNKNCPWRPNRTLDRYTVRIVASRLVSTNHYCMRAMIMIILPIVVSQIYASANFAIIAVR